MDTSYAKNILGDNHTALSGLKVLGILWESTTDNLCFDLGRVCDVAEKIEPTKRNIITVVSKFYDPLGGGVSRAQCKGSWMGRAIVNGTIVKVEGDIEEL